MTQENNQTGAARDLYKGNLLPDFVVSLIAQLPKQVACELLELLAGPKLVKRNYTD